MKVFISGASGLLGSNCLRYFQQMNWEVTGSHLSFPTPDTVYFNTLADDPENFDVVAYQPEVIVHCGALTHVDYCETHETESLEKTVQSTRNLLQLSKKCNARFVFISTDYVFDGEKGPYVESDPVHPVSVYGRHKLMAEKLVQEASADHLILRITNVYGDELRGKNFVARIVDQCQKGATLQLKLPYDQLASPTNAYDIARALFLLLRDHKKGCYHIGGTDYMNRVSLALKVLAHFPDAQYELTPLATAALGQPAARPLRGGFIPLKFQSEYPRFLFGNVDTYLAALLSKNH